MKFIACRRLLRRTRYSLHEFKV